MKKSLQLFIFLITLFLSMNILYAQNIIEVGEGVNAIDDVLFTAQPGDIIELTTNGGVYYEFFSILIDKPLTIRAKEGLTTKPILYTDDTRAIITIRDDFTIEGVMLYGAGGAARTETGIRTDTTDVKTGYNLTIDNCLFFDFNQDPSDPDGHAFRGDPSTQANKVKLTNSVIIETGSEGIYYKNAEIAPGSVLDFHVENCTFCNTGDDAIYVEDHDNDISTDNGKFTVKQVTIHNANSKSIYPKELDEDVLIQNFIVSKDEEDTGTDPCRIYSSNSIAEYFLSFNIDSISLRNDASVDPEKTLEMVDPMYLDMLAGNFRLDPESPAVGFGAEGKTLGDPKWWPSTPAKIEIDGQFDDWAGLTPLIETENDPAISDTFEMKAVWTAIDDEKISFRIDFFDDVNFNTGQDSGPLNMWQGWHRIYFDIFKDTLEAACRIRSYAGVVDTNSFSRLRWRNKGNPIGATEYDGERFKGVIAWNPEGTSMECYMLLDSLYITDDVGNVVHQVTYEDSMEVRFQIEAGDPGVGRNYLPAGEGGKLVEGDKIKIALKDYYTAASVITSVREENYTPATVTNYELSQNYPNPFNPTTKIKYSVPQSGNVTLKVFDILGREVATLVDDVKQVGTYELSFDATGLSSGLYFYQFNASDYSITRKMMVIK